MNKVRFVHVVFKTHLDIGFTDLASLVKENYLNRFIPAAIQTAQELRKRGGAERFVWTTGSWLIHTCFNAYDVKKCDALAEAIHRGDITWHALPFTTHTELMDERLFDYGLSLSAQLDRKFGRTTSAGKMTDVPGHTIGMVPLLAARGIKYLHIGVNGCSSLPDTPRVFRWRSPDGNEILVQYDKSYGETLILPDSDEALVVVNANDNKDPPNTGAVIRIFTELAQQFPGAEIRASTLDAFLPALLKAQGLPVLTEEIGDTWIHGIGTDPLKTAQFRQLLRLKNDWEKKGKLQEGTGEYAGFLDELIMVSEHTWGLDSKVYLADYTHWSIEDFHQARKTDHITIPAGDSEFTPFYAFAQHKESSYSFFESSHREQRSYIDNAIASLPPELAQEAVHSFEQLIPRREIQGVMCTGEFDLGPWRAVIGETGGLVSLKDVQGRELAGSGGIGVYSYQTFSHEDYERYHQEYNRNMTKGIWAYPDFGKPGMQYAQPCQRHALYNACVQSIHVHHTDDYDEGSVLLAAGDESDGFPQTLIIRYRSSKNDRRLEVCLDWFDKKATRLPQALWLSICLNTSDPQGWVFSKLGTLINPMHVAAKGNRCYHAIEYAGYKGSEGQYRITPLDSPLAALGKRKMLQFDNRFEDPSGGLHCNVYNNIWGTNFPLWYEENGRTRFVIEFDGVL